MSWEIVSPENVDIAKWNNCVVQAGGKIYNRPSYLLPLLQHWCLCVWNDYEAVLALPYKKIAFCKFAYLPPFVQTLDICGKNVTNLMLEDLRKWIKTHFLFAILSQSEAISLNGDYERKRINYRISMAAFREKGLHLFAKSRIKKLKKSFNNQLVIDKNQEVDEVVELYRHAYGNKANYETKHYLAFKKLSHAACQERFCAAYFVKNIDGEKLFGCLIFQTQEASYYLLGAPTEEGRRLQATSFAIFQLLEAYQDKIYFDLEGSMIPSVANYYQQFHPETEYYKELFISRLPTFLKKMIAHRFGFK